MVCVFILLNYTYYPFQNISIVILQNKEHRFVHRMLSAISFLVGIPIHAESMAQGCLGPVARPSLLPDDTGVLAILENYNRQPDDARQYHLQRFNE